MRRTDTGKNSSPPKNKSLDIENCFTENIFDTVRESLLLLNKDLKVVKASRSFYNLFKVNSDETIGTFIYNLGNQQWNIPKLKILLETILPEKTFFDEYEVEHEFARIGKRVMLLNARQIEGAKGEEKLILLAIEDITGRKQREELLSESNRLTHEYLDILFNRTHIPIIIWDSLFSITHINHAFEELCGYTWKEIKNKNLRFLFLQDKAELTIELLKSNLLRGDEEIIELDIHTKNKKLKTILWNSTNILDKEGIKVVATIAQDITSRKRSEEALRTLESRYRRLFETAKDGILILDADTGKIDDVNPFLIELLGYSKENLIGKEIWEIGFFKDIAANKEKFIELQEKEYIRYEDLPLETIDGRKIYVEFVSNVYMVNNRKVIQCNIRDISDRYSAEKELRESEERFRIVSENLIDVVFDWDIKEKIDWYGDIDSLMGCEQGKFPRTIGEWADLIHPEDKDKVMTALQNELEGSAHYSVEYRIMKNNGEWRWWSARGNTLRDEKQKPIKLLGSITDITESKHAHEKLKTSEEKYRSLIDNMNEGIFISDKNGTFLFANNALAHIHGFDNKEKLINKNIMDFVEQSSRDEMVANFEREIKTGESAKELELPIVRADGSTAIILIKSTVIRHENKVTGLSGIVRDITESREAEKRVIESEEKFRIITEKSADAIFIADQKGKYLYVNHKALEMLGYSMDEMLSFTIIDLLPKNKVEEYSKRFQQVITEGSTYSEIELLKKDGYIMPVDLNSVLLPNKLIYGSCRDISERKKAEKELRKSENEFRMLAESMPQIVWITDAEGSNIYFSQQWVDYTGMTLKESYGHGWNSPFHPDDQQNAWEAWQNATQNNGVYSIEARLRRADGLYKWFLVRGVPVKDEQENIIKWFGTCTDIHELKLTEVELISAKDKAEESNKLKSEFLAQMSHEIRTPLNAVLGNVEYLNELFNNKIDDEVTESFESIEIASKRIIRTVDLILNTAELKTSGYKPNYSKINLDSKILTSLCQEHQLSAKQKGLKLIYNCRLTDTVVYGDMYSIKQIFSNLIDNAIKYTSEGIVEIILGKNKTDNIMVEVKDTGIGISNEFLAQLFEPFTQEEQGYARSFEGNGLGLSLVKNYCKINNAVIEVESEKNVGSTFRVIFHKNFGESAN
jgi:PAS domain S-box-containing protein